MYNTFNESAPPKGRFHFESPMFIDTLFTVMADRKISFASTSQNGIHNYEHIERNIHRADVYLCGEYNSISY